MNGLFFFSSPFVGHGFTGRRGMNHQLCVGEMPFRATLARPRFQEQSQSCDLGVGLVSDGHVVMRMLEHVPWHFGATDDDHQRSVTTNPGHNLAVRLSVHGKVDHDARCTVARILRGETFDAPNAFANVLALHVPAKAFIHRGHVGKDAFVLVSGKQELVGPERTSDEGKMRCDSRVPPLAVAQPEHGEIIGHGSSKRSPVIGVTAHSTTVSTAPSSST